MIDLVADWLAGVSAKEICESYGIFEGNLTKLVLKASNLLEELVALATLKKDTALLNKLHDLPKNLVHGIATPDSLYLRL
jgi:superfamily II RNA helicase